MEVRLPACQRSERLRAAALVVALLLPSVPPIGHAYTFASQNHMFTIGVPVYSVAVGDVTGDGLPELFSCVSGVGALVRYRNLGGGEFVYDQALATGAWPLDLIAVDVTGDGQLDIVVVEKNANSIRVFPSGTDPSFPLAVGSGPQGVAAGDVNGDGIVDLVAANAAASSISLLLGLGGGSFQPQQVYLVGHGTNAVVIGDLNGDGRKDVVAASGSTPYGFDVCLGSATGIAVTSTHYGLNGSADGMALSDVDLDGDVDVVVSTLDETVPFINTGTGNLAGGTPFFLGAGVRVGDLNGDGVPDLVGFDNILKEMITALGTGAGIFTAFHHYEQNGAAGRSAIEDVDGDGRADIVVPQGEMSVYLNQGSGYFGPEMRWWAGHMPTGVCLGRFNGDICDDLLVAPSSDSTVLYFSGGSAGLSASPQAIYIARRPTDVLAGNFTNDAYLDAVVSCGTGNVVTLLPGTGAGTFGARTEFGTAASPAKMAAGKLNGDAFLDLVVPCRTANVVSVLLNSGSGGFLPKVDYSTSSLPEAVAVGDLNHDGIQDLVVACGGGIGKINVLLGRGDGTFQPRVNYSSNDIAKDVKLAYVDADSNLDAVVANYSGFAVLKGNGLGGFGPPNQVILFGCESTVARDFDGDGLVDVAVNWSGGWVSVLLGNGDGTFHGRTDYGCQDDTWVVTAGDVTGDGWPDLVAANRRVGKPFETLAGCVTLLRNNAPAISSVGLVFAGDGDRAQSIALSPPWPSPSLGLVTFEASTTAIAILDFMISDVQGRVVRQLATRQIGQFPVRMQWDGRTDAGEPVRSGVYWLLAKGAAGSASRRITIVR